MEKWADAHDVIRRREIRKLSNKELSAQLAKTRKRLNARMRELERTGYYKYSGSYSRLETYIRSNLGGYVNRNYQYEFTSKPFAKESRRKREEILLQWEHFLSYEGLTSKSVEQLLQSEANKLNQATGTKKYTVESVKSIRNLMRYWREDVESALKDKELLDSESARRYFQENFTMTNAQLTLFVDQLEKNFTIETKNGKTIDPEKTPLFIQWLDNYNPLNNRSEIGFGGVNFNIATGEIYDIHTPYTLEVEYNNHYLVRGNERINIENEIGVEKLYDFLLNNL